MIELYNFRRSTCCRNSMTTGHKSFIKRVKWFVILELSHVSMNHRLWSHPLINTLFEYYKYDEYDNNKNDKSNMIEKYSPIHNYNSDNVKSKQKNFFRWIFIAVPKRRHNSHIEHHVDFTGTLRQERPLFHWKTLQYYLEFQIFSQ